jgi:hypothetical protein
MSQEDLNEELAAVEAALASVGPRPSRLDRDQVMFLAGRASVGDRTGPRAAWGRRWAWPAAFSLMTAVAATLLVTLLVRQPEPQRVERARPGLIQPATEKDVGPQQREAPFQPPAPVEPFPPGALAVSPSLEPEAQPAGRDMLYSFGPRGMLVAELRPPEPAAGPPGQRARSRGAPVPYREMLKRLMEGAEPDRAFLPGRPNSQAS